jgi:hypothetical protein
MPPKKGAVKSPHFKHTTPSRKSIRVSNASINSSARKRKPESSESDFEHDDSSASDFKTTKTSNKNKRTRKHDSTEPEDGENEDSDDESQPPKVTIIPLPKAREAGDVPYEDHKIHENTMLFLGDLKRNNNREWMRCSYAPTTHHVVRH